MKFFAALAIIAAIIYCSIAGTPREVIVSSAMVERRDGFTILVDVTAGNNWPPIVSISVPDYIKSGDCVRVVKYWDGAIRIERN